MERMSEKVTVDKVFKTTQKEKVVWKAKKQMVR
jgi:hypothetical protein